MKQAKKLERSIKQWLRERNIYFGRKAKDSDLDDFLRRVRPFTTEHKLVRIGDACDGGYLLPDDLVGISACFSPGVSLEVHFEMDLAARGIKSFLADYSVVSLPVDNPMFDFERKFLGMDNDSVYMTLDQWVRNKVGDDPQDLILQMDIEGAEYEVILDSSHELLRRFRIIVIEFHRLDYLLDKFGHKIIDMTFRKILRSFEIVHVHPNNLSSLIKYKQYAIPTEMEFTFLRRDRIAGSKPATHFPHPLDSRNMVNRPDVVLPECWFSKGLI